jgi:hypothetical protein
MAIWKISSAVSRRKTKASLDSRAEVKGVGHSNDLRSDGRIVFAESFIDMLSHAAMSPDDRARYRSVAGGLNPKHPELMRADILALPPGSVVVAAMDASKAGQAFASVLRRVGPGGRLSFDAAPPPEEGQHWNDVLKPTCFPAAQNFLRPSRTTV